MNGKRWSKGEIPFITSMIFDILKTLNLEDQYSDILLTTLFQRLQGGVWISGMHNIRILKVNNNNLTSIPVEDTMI